MSILNKRRLATAAAFAVGVAWGVPLAWGMPPTALGAASPAAATPAPAPPIVAVDPAATPFDAFFELEGDATQESGGNANAMPPVLGADDWSNILMLNGKSSADSAIAKLDGTTQCVGLTCNDLNFPGVLNRIAPNTIFTGGVTKDPLPLEGWLWKSGSVQPKDNIQDAFAAAYTLNEDLSAFDLKNDVVFVFGLDRITNNGDAFLGFWFFKSCVDTNGPAGNGGTTHFGNCSGGTATHTVGDLLVLMNFPQASFATPTVGVWEWVAANGDVSTNLLTVIPVGTDLCTTSGDLEACGITNTGATPIPSPWLFQTKLTGVGPNLFPTDSFYEGGLNLSRLLRRLGQNLGCFTSFLAETRASESPTSTLSAFVTGKFNLCGMSASKVCGKGVIDNMTNTVDYPYTFEVKNTGIAPLFQVVAVDDSGTPLDTSDDQMFNLPNLASKGSPGDTFDSLQESFSSTDLSGPTNTIHVTANTQSNGLGVTIKTSAKFTCTPPDISPTLQVTKVCSGDDPYKGSGVTPLGIDPTGPNQALGSYLAVVGGQIQIRVKVDIHVCNKSSSPTAINLNMVTVTDQPLQMDQTTPDGSPRPVFLGGTADGGVLDAGTCKDYMDDYAPSGATITTGEHGDSVDFFDVAKANGKSVVGGKSTGDQISNKAVCPLCIP